MTPRARVLWSLGDAMVVRLEWRPRDGGLDQERFQVLRVRDGKIREMAEYRQAGEATRAAKRFAAKSGT